MKYMLLIYLAEDALDDAAREDCYQKSAQLCQDLAASRQYLDAAPLHPVSTSTSVRVRDGKVMVTDGPFAETREQLGGFYLIDAKNLDEAIHIAARIPPASVGTVEIRPVMEVMGLPKGQGAVSGTAASSPGSPGAVPLAMGVTHKRYMLLCYDDKQFWDNAGGAALQKAIEEAVQLTHELDAKAQYRSAAPLHPTSMAKSVRVRNGNRLVTDGPFAETREHLGGYYLIDAKDLDEAIGIAARHPGARVGTVEIRPVMAISGLPTL
jgi:hypothetical protein